jgi:hypothetical protein
MLHPEHTDQCRCMFRLFEVAGELQVRPDARRSAEQTTTPTPAPKATPLTGFFMQASSPPTVIVSDLFADVLPAGYDGDVLLLGGDTGPREIALSEADFEEVADLLVPRDADASRMGREGPRWPTEVPSWRLSTGTVFRP